MYCTLTVSVVTYKGSSVVWIPVPVVSSPKFFEFYHSSSASTACCPHNTMCTLKKQQGLKSQRKSLSLWKPWQKKRNQFCPKRKSTKELCMSNTDLSNGLLQCIFCILKDKSSLLKIVGQIQIGMTISKEDFFVFPRKLVWLSFVFSRSIIITKTVLVDGRVHFLGNCDGHFVNVSLIKRRGLFGRSILGRNCTVAI